MNFLIRKAKIEDAKNIVELLDVYAKKQIVLARDEEDIKFYIKNFTVCEIDNEICGCVAVRDFGNGLKEVRSLVVKEEAQGLGVGRKLIEYIIANFKENHEEVRLFALTYKDGFFEKLGFHIVKKEMFPEKIWADCEMCPKKENCDEIAVLLHLNK